MSEEDNSKLHRTLVTDAQKSFSLHRPTQENHIAQNPYFMLGLFPRPSQNQQSESSVPRTQGGQKSNDPKKEQ